MGFETRRRGGDEILTPQARYGTAAEAALQAKAAELSGWLGNSVGSVSYVTGAIFTLALEAASLYWHPDTGAHEVHGAIRDHYGQFGGANGFLGAPTTDESATADGVGRYNHFQGGTIVWHPELGAFEVHGAIREKWSAFGWEQGLLGYPLTDETPTVDGAGRFNHFQGGSIFWHPDLGAFEVHGAIRDKWAALGWERGYLGYPISDESDGGLMLGPLSRFQRGDLAFPLGLGAVEFPHSVVLQSGPIVTDRPVGGWVELALSSRGDFTYRGHLHNSGFPSYLFDIATALKLPGDNEALVAKYGGELEGSVELSPDRDAEWSETGQSDKIRDRWDEIGAAAMHTKLELGGDVTSVIAFVLAVLGAIAYVVLRTDSGSRSKGCAYTDSDGNEIRQEVFWSDGQPEPPCPP